MGSTPDYVRLAEEVLGIRNASAALAERLVAHALVIEDRREAWHRVGERICAAAPQRPGVYVLRDADGVVLYVGKANNVRRRLRAHFAPRRWRATAPALARAAEAEWTIVGSEVEALVREAEWIRDLAPIVNTQVGLPSIDTRAIPDALVRDTLVIVPSVEDDSLELVAARADGPLMIQRTRRNGRDLAVHAARVWKFFRPPFLSVAAAASGRALSPIVFSWLAGRGADATRIAIRDVASKADLQARLECVVRDRDLFSERIVVLHSMFRSTRRRVPGAEAGPVPKRP
jgi:predicted GIY-YIG superfamily endonuclease